MVMCFALCASLAFAQTKHAAPRQWQGSDKAAVKKADTKDGKAATVGYNASIFGAKAGGDVIASWDFSDESTFTPGNITGGTITNQSGSQEDMIVHAQTYAYATWARIPDTTTATINSYGTTSVANGGYPVICGNYRSWWKNYFIEGTTPMNGFMLMSMMDAYSTIGGSGSYANFDSYFAFNPVSTVGHSSVKMDWFQLFTKFNYDQSYIDYSFNGTDWYQYEILVHGVDLGSNDDSYGNVSFLLPSACAGQSSLYLRVRWACDQSSGSSTDDGIYGYFWIIDDVKLVESDANSAKLIASDFYAGAYHQVPQGMEVPVTWYASVMNNGSLDQDNMTLSLTHLNANLDGANQFATFSPDVAFTSGLQIDTMINGAGIERFFNTYGTAGLYVNGNVADANAKLPTTVAGDNYLVPSFGGTNIPAIAADTIFYNVNALQESPDGLGQVAVWALDNGILTPSSYWVDGLNGNYLSTGLGDDDPSYTKPGYFATNRFVTGSNIPSNWCIRGMQLVAATQYNSSDMNNTVQVMPGAHISTMLYSDDPEAGRDEGGASGYLNYGTSVPTGAETYETKASDFNYYDENMTRITRTSDGYQEYMLPGTYNVINIMFPEQPELQPNTTYRLGYELTDGYFGLAGQTSRYVHHYDGDPDTVLYYVYYASDTLRDGSTNQLKKYGRRFTFNAWDQIICDPDQGWTRGTSSLPPMIRMLVGPKVTYPTFNATFNCYGYNGLDLNGLTGTGVVSMDEQESYCGQTVEMTYGSSNAGFIAEAEAGYIVYSIVIDNTVVYTYGATISEEYEDYIYHNTTSGGIDYVIFEMSNYPLDVNVDVYFADESDEPTLYTISVYSDDENMGHVIGGGEFDEGATTTIQAIAEDGYVFSYWTKDDETFDGNDVARLNIVVENDAEYVAYFEAGQATQYTLTVTSADDAMGYTIPSGAATYDEGSIVTITAVPYTGYDFVQWSDGNTSAARNVVVNADATYTATFVANGEEPVTYYTVTVQSADNTMGTTMPSGVNHYEAGSQVTISAIANPGYEFVRWNDNNTEANRTITVNENATYTAYFKAEGSEDPQFYTITVVSANPTYGTVNTEINGQYPSGQVLTIAATPNAGYTFDHWSDGGAMSHDITVGNADATYTAYFVANSAINEATGSVSMNIFPNPASGKVNVEVSGVNGSVNCSVLDMSGRMVYNQTINAEQTTTIDISNLAKGAYFVRITNNEFSKVEKLVVR